MKRLLQSKLKKSRSNTGGGRSFGLSGLGQGLLCTSSVALGTGPIPTFPRCPKGAEAPIGRTLDFHHLNVAKGSTEMLGVPRGMLKDRLTCRNGNLLDIMEGVCTTKETSGVVDKVAMESALHS